MTPAMIEKMEAVLGTLPSGGSYAETGWVLPDGRLLNLAPPATERGRPGFTGHRMSHQTAIDHVFPNSGLRVADALKAGLVRIVPEGCTVQAVCPMTEEQVATVVAFFTANRQAGMQFEFGPGTDMQVIDYPNHLCPAAAVADIQERLARDSG